MTPPKKLNRVVTSAEKARKQKELDDIQKMVQPKYKVRTKPLNPIKDSYDSDDEFKVPVFKATPFKLTQVVIYSYFKNIFGDVTPLNILISNYLNYYFN